MYRAALAFAAIFAVAGVSAAEEDAPPVSVEEAAPAGAEVPADGPVVPEGAAAELYLRYDAFLSSPVERSIQEEISIDLIDLDALRSAIERQMGPVLRLSLDECIRIALQENPDIIITAYEPLKSDADIQTARGEFDPIVQGTFNYVEASTALNQQTQLFSGGISSVESYNTSTTATLAGKLHYGTQYSVSMGFNREETTFGQFITDYDATATMTLTQPLLRGFGKKVNTVRIRAAQNARRLTEHQLKLSALNTVAEVVKAYWDLVGAVENLRVRNGSLANAERLLKINETRRDIGTAADIEVLQSKAGVATRQGELISARSTVNDAADRLKNLLNLRDGAVFSKVLVIPIDRPKAEMEPLVVESIQSSVDISVERALAHRPEVHMSAIEIENAELDAMRARNDRLPQIDITSSYAQGGRSGEVSETLYGITQQQNQVFTYGLQASMPLGNRAAKGAYRRAQLTVKQAEQRLEQTRQAIMMNVHLASRQVVTNQILVESNRQARRLQEANVLAEEKRLRLGVTTSYQVLLVQDDLTAAQTLELQARIGYEKALIDLQLAEGLLLDNLGIEVETPEKVTRSVDGITLAPRWE